MIVVRSPLRITLGGGGTDLPVWYKKNKSFLIFLAINKYIFVTINKEIMIIKYGSAILKLNQLIVFQTFKMNI